MKTQQQKSSITVLSAALLLTACGGGGSDNKTTAQVEAEQNSKIAAAAPDCPLGYKSVTIDNSSVAGATFSLKAGNATFSFQTYAQAIPPTSIRVCFGVSPNAIVDGGMYMLSDTYEIKTYPLAMFNSQFSNLLNPTLTVDFTLDKVPAGSGIADLVNKVKVFNDGEGALMRTVQESSLFSMQNNTGRLVVFPGKEARYVVAFKP
jgi:hypothetical protein